ncbi:MAG: hypothetical protein QXQ79_02295 [Candidatus Nanoarchaeia archaeon]
MENLFTLILGIVGSIAIIIAWLWETYESVSKHKLAIHSHFALTYIIALALLTFYSWAIKSKVFTALNLFLLFAILGEFIYSLKIKRINKHGKK